jgi:hypothetical protein
MDPARSHQSIPSHNGRTKFLHMMGGQNAGRVASGLPHLEDALGREDNALGPAEPAALRLRVELGEEGRILRRCRLRLAADGPDGRLEGGELGREGLIERLGGFVAAAAKGIPSLFNLKEDVGCWGGLFLRAHA